MRIAVIGAGIAGLSVAAGLQRDGYDVTVFEQRPEPSPVGAGLTLFRNACDALDMMGLGDSVRAVSGTDIASMRTGQRDPAGSWLIAVPPSTVASMRSVHRSELHHTLSSHLFPGTVHAGQTARVAADGTPRVTIGERAEEFDLVVVADGIRSTNRKVLGLDTDCGTRATRRGAASHTAPSISAARPAKHGAVDNSSESCPSQIIGSTGMPRRTFRQARTFRTNTRLYVTDSHSGMRRSRSASPLPRGPRCCDMTSTTSRDRSRHSLEAGQF